MFIHSQQCFNASSSVSVTIIPDILDVGNADIQFEEKEGILVRHLMPGLSIEIQYSEEEFVKALSTIQASVEGAPENSSSAKVMNKAIAETIQKRLFLVCNDSKIKIPLRRKNSFLKPEGKWIRTRNDLLTSDHLCRFIFGSLISHIDIECDTSSYNLNVSKKSCGFSSFFQHFSDTLAETRKTDVGIPLILKVSTKSGKKKAVSESSDAPTEE